jgi:hypothetical protein
MQVKKNESKERKMMVGIGEVQILGFNPSREELDNILGIERDEDYEAKPEFEYFKEGVELKQKDEDGNETDSIFCDQLNVTVWVKEVKSGEKLPINFTLYKTEDISRTGKYKFVNQHGKSIYCDDEANLSEYFTNTPGKVKQPLAYKKAYKGEANLLEFLASWTGINPFDTESSLFPEDTKKFWTGNMKELNSLVIDFSTNTVMCNFSVRVKEVTDNDGNTETKEYNRIETKGFCSGHYMKFFRQYAKNNFDGLHTKAKMGNTSMYQLAKFVEDIYGEYGVKNFTFKGELTEYQEGMNPVNAESAVVTDTNADY